MAPPVTRGPFGQHEVTLSGENSGFSGRFSELGPAGAHFGVGILPSAASLSLEANLSLEAIRDNPLERRRMKTTNSPC